MRIFLFAILEDSDTDNYAITSIEELLKLSAQSNQTGETELEEGDEEYVLNESNSSDELSYDSQSSDVEKVIKKASNLRAQVKKRKRPKIPSKK